MDPMDFTMDDSSNVLAGSTLRYQCQQQPQSQIHSQTNPPNFTPHASSVQGREIQHYDPVHESSAWYQQHNHSSSTPRPAFPVSQNISQWSPVPQSSESAQHWSHFAEMERRTQDYNSSSDYRRSFMPWTNDSRGFEGFSHSVYAPSSASTGNTVSTDPALQFRSQTTLRGYAMDTQHQQYLFSRDIARANLPPHSTTLTPHAASSEPRPLLQTSSGTTPSSVEPSTTVPQQTTISGLRPGFARTARSNVSRQEDILEGSRRRRLVASWDSDDDEESFVEMDRAEVARRHAAAAAEALFGGEFDDDRSIAALRGAMAGGKRVPSKEALESLETVKVADLKDADRTCIICYNEFGVSNPEGEIENPIRLPKCKHVFGDKCVKKWFEDSDSCPYCRDKLPSELAIRKSLGAYQSYRLAHREQLRLATLAQRSRYSSYTPAGVSTIPADMENHRSPSAASRAPEEYEYLMRQAESWSHSPPNRSSNADSPERRRQARGRHSAMRGPHFLGRPTSVGSARASNPSFTHAPPRNFADLYSPRRIASSEAAAREALAREARDRENRASILASAASPFRASWDRLNSDPGAARRTPPPPTGPAVPHEEASPPVAVGSGVSARREVNQLPTSTISRPSVGSDHSDFIFNLTSDPRTLDESNAEARSQHASTGMPSFGALLTVSNNNGARPSSDSSGDRDELAHVGRDSSQIPAGWGSIN